MQAIILSKIGAPSNFKIEKVADPQIAPKQVLVRHRAIGVNFLDVCFRRGQYQLNKFPAILGMEACGYVEKIGSEVIDYKVGQRVAYATAGLGCYVEKRAVDQRYLVNVPDALTDVQVASCLFKGLTAHTLLNRVYMASRIKKILIHSVAGGLGHIMCQYARYLGIEVFGTVGSDEKIAIAQSFGCNHVINYSKQDYVTEIAKITNSGGVGLVYDGVGKDNINKSLQCLWPMGFCINHGESAGPIEKIDFDLMLMNSLFFTRPLMAMYKSPRAELAVSADEVFAGVIKGIFRLQTTEFAFKDVAKAHKALENRETTGSLVLVV
ncbi:MAG: quinone oxidoreductase family protein [Alphaproteobacteria bacterium]